MSTIALLLLSAAFSQAGSLPWRLADLEASPKHWNAPTEEPGVKAVWLDGPSYQGKPTRIFAYYNVPSSSGKLPAMVLIHGGGGTAFAEWVRLWSGRGYAAIAVDTVGTVPDRADPTKLWNPTRKRHEFSGPAGWGDFKNVDAPITDQWTYHAVAAAILAHSFLRTLVGVDPKRIGVTGISWGGYLTAIVASIDPRFRFGIPVYGCGFLGEDSAWLKDFDSLGKERAAKWLKLWDPSAYLAQDRRPMFWINGTNDFAYPMPSWQKSYRLAKGQHMLSLQVRMKHGHQEGAKAEEIAAYAKAMFMDGPSLVHITTQGEAGGEGWVKYGKGARPVRAALNFTRDTGKWQDRKWETVPAVLDWKTGRAHAKIPDGARVFYLNLMDEHGLIVSSEHEERLDR